MMKAFFQRLNLTGSKDKDASGVKEKFSWPPPPPPQPATSTPVTSSPIPAFKPLPEIAPAQIREQLLSDKPQPEKQEQTPERVPERVLERVQESPRSESRASRTDDKPNRKTNGTQYSDTQKKVAFRSPPPTPTAIPERAASPETQPAKTNITRFQATHGASKDARASSSSAGSKTDLIGSSSKASSKGASTLRNTQSPYMQKDIASNQSLRSGSPYSQMSQASGSRILGATSWSEVAEEDLVSNLGSRERTRQEVLFEIISSEERYVVELIKMRDTFIEPLLHPFSNAPMTPPPATPNIEYEYYRTASPEASSDQLPPIAALFMAPSPPPIHTPGGKEPQMDVESMLTDDDDEGLDTLGQGYSHRKPAASQTAKVNHPRSPYRASSAKPPPPTKNVPFPSRSHHSLPPPPRAQMTSSTHSLGRQSSMVDHNRGVRERNYSQGATTGSPDQKTASPQKSNLLRKFKKSVTTPDGVFGIGAIPPHLLPPDLKICLEVIDGGVLEGHRRLGEALKKRYEDQYPLVRSLADVFVTNSDIFKGYATYVLHLERALEQVDDALSSIPSKKPKNQDAADYQKMCTFLRKLEETAAERGETGLAITLSKPFQRLLKYPLLFQNLLFHTDPSTFEYESSLQLAAEVESIVRSIEDEKIQKEERDQTRDVFARIEGLEKVRQLALPKPSRILVSERQLKPSSPPGKSLSPPAANGKNVKGKSSFKRLNDVLQGTGVGGKRDLWLVAFNDVILQCQRTGTTSVPLVATVTSRTNSMPELQGKAKYATTGRKNAQTKPRNLYKFIKIETWAIGDVTKGREGVVTMEDVARSRSSPLSNQPRIVPMPDDDDEDDDDGDSDDSDKKSKMSFSYWGADKVTVQKPVVKGRVVPVARRGGGAASYGRESSANAKFGTRLVSTDSSNTRPGTRRTQPVVPSTRRTQPFEDNRTSSGRPDWNSSTRTPLSNASAAKRSRNVSQSSVPVRASQTSKVLSSPTPTLDSGIA